MLELDIGESGVEPVSPGRGLNDAELQVVQALTTKMLRGTGAVVRLVDILGLAQTGNGSGHLEQGEMGNKFKVVGALHLVLDGGEPGVD